MKIELQAKLNDAVDRAFTQVCVAILDEDIAIKPLIIPYYLGLAADARSVTQLIAAKAFDPINNPPFNYCHKYRVLGSKKDDAHRRLRAEGSVLTDSELLRGIILLAIDDFAINVRDDGIDYRGRGSEARVRYLKEAILLVEY